MKKQKLKNLLKLGILIFGITLFFTNCEKENITPIEETNKNLEEESVFIEEVSISQIPQVKHFLDKNPVASKSKSSKESSSKNDETDFGEVDFSKILKLTDSLGQVTYTFRMIKPASTTEENIGFYFDNLTIAVKDNNEDYSAYILRYFYGEQTKTPDYSYQGLSGHIERFSLTETSFGLDFIDTSLFAKEECKYTVKTDCGLTGHHSSLDDPGCSSNILTVTILQECFDFGTTVANTGNYSTNTGGEPGFGGGGRRGSTTPIISPYDERDLGILDGIRNILNLTSSEYTWLYSKYSTAMAIWYFLEDDASIEAKREAYMRIKVEMLKDTDTNTPQYTVNNGTYKSRESLRHTHSYADLNTGDVYYKLENGLHLLASANGSKINKDVKWTSDFPAEGYHYIYSDETEKWYEYRLPPADYPNADIDFLLKAFWQGVATTARYATPIEDIIILIDGKDFDGVEQNKAATAGFMIVGFIPGGKILKPISKGTGKVWKFVIKNGDKVFTRTVRELTEETIQHFDNYVDGAQDLLQEALRKGDILDDEIIIEVGQEIADLSAKKGRKLTWPEVKALFKRGNDFNDKASRIYDYNEVTLKGIGDKARKRLDTYIPPSGGKAGEIISRKATTLADIKPETFKGYLKELITKYPKGAEINAPKFGNEFVNKVLDGDYFLEIPLSNKTFFENSNTFQQVLTQFNVDNNVLVGIKYLAE